MNYDNLIGTRERLIEGIGEINEQISNLTLDKEDIEYSLFEVEREIDRLAYEDDGIF